MRGTKKVLTGALAASAVALAAGAAQADAATLKKGLYDCHYYNFSTASLDYHGSLKLKSGRRYQHALGRDGRKLEKPKSGRYKIKGKWIRFKSGPLTRTPGRIYPADKNNRHPWFNFYTSDGEDSGVSCYIVNNPDA
jgi:hypothetical protein